MINIDLLIFINGIDDGTEAIKLGYICFDKCKSFDTYDINKYRTFYERSYKINDYVRTADNGSYTFKNDDNNKTYRIYYSYNPGLIDNLRFWKMSFNVYRIENDKLIPVGNYSDLLQVDVWKSYGKAKTITFYDCYNCIEEEEIIKICKKGCKRIINEKEDEIIKCEEDYTNTKEEGLVTYAKYQGCFLIDQLLRDHLTALARINKQFPEEKP